MKKLLMVLVVVIVLAGLSYGAWRLIKPDNKLNTAKPAAQTNTAPTLEPTQSKDTDVPEVTGTETFENGPLGLNLTYPNSWKASATDDLGVRVTSPDFKYTTTDKGTVTGNFRIYIRKGARDKDSKYIGRGVTIMPSEKLKYTKPAPGQRTETYLSSFGLDDTNNFAFFMIAGNFNLQKGETLGPNYGKESETYIIAGGFSATNLTDDMATNMVPTDTYAKKRAYQQAVDIIKSIQLL